MDKREAVKLAQKFIKIVKDNYPLQRAYLFGSYVKGNYHEESDIDIAFVFKEVENTYFMQLELMRLRRKLDSRIEPHPFGESDFVDTNPLVAEIMKYGNEIPFQSG